jgi:hypothetical protein
MTRELGVVKEEEISDAISLITLGNVMAGGMFLPVLNNVG